ncbi:MAG TPA: hypothetical protein VF153_00995 [Candidatus Limnocylindria bacterium]
MARTTRFGIAAGGLLLVLVAGSALATRTPHVTPQGPAAASHEPEAPPSADELAHAVGRLDASGITVSADQLRTLAADYGLGGAIRLLAWADASGKTVDELKAMRDGGDGWGQMAQDLGLNPGIGSIMGQGGDHGPAGAPGLSKEKPDKAGGNGADEGAGD